MDKKIESLNAVGIILVSGGVAMIQSVPVDSPGALNTIFMGVGMICGGMAILMLRGNLKEKNISRYVKRKIKEYDES